MARTAVPYEAVTPVAPAQPQSVVGAAPTLQSRNVHGADFNIGLYTWGERGTRWVGMQTPYAGQGLVSPVFPHYQPSTVAPNAIKPALFITRNYYSPVSHSNARYEFSKTLPARAAFPLTKLPTQNNKSRRPSGSPFTIPYPLGTPQWPTSAQWLANRMRDSQF